MAEVLDREAAANGPSPVPLEVPLDKAVPPELASIWKVNWSDDETRAPLINVLSWMVANRTANMAPWRPDPRSVVTNNRTPRKELRCRP